MATSLLHEKFQRANGQALEAQMRGESEEFPTLAGSFGAEQAWHLHQFAVDAKEAAENIAEWADMIDRAVHDLYLSFKRGEAAMPKVTTFTIPETVTLPGRLCSR